MSDIWAWWQARVPPTGRWRDAAVEAGKAYDAAHVELNPVPAVVGRYARKEGRDEEKLATG